jgi:hypothetical protein
VAVLLVFVACAGIIVFLDVVSTHIYAGTSDKATIILEGQAMAGDPFLHGWILTSDSYWLTDALFYTVATHLVGIRPSIVNWDAAFMLGLAIVAGAVVATRGRRASAALAGAATVVVLLGLPTRAAATYLLGPAFHVSTVLLAVVAFAALRRGRFDWRWGIAVAALAIGMLSDLLMVAYGIVPVFLAGLAAMARARRWQVGAAAVGAAAAAVAAGEAAGLLARAVGTFTLGPGVKIVSLRAMVTNLENVPRYEGALLGFNNSLGTGGVPSGLEDVHLLGAVIVTAATLVALWFLFTGVLRARPLESGTSDQLGERWLDDVLAIALIGTASTFIALAQPASAGTRYLVGTVVLTSVLTGRLVARVWEGVHASSLKRGLWLAGAGMTVCFAVGTGFTVSRPIAVSSPASLASFLEAHHLRSGVGDYWSASITTVASGGAVVVRPVWADGADTLSREMYESSASWYAGQRFQFLVYQVPTDGGVDLATATRTWGPPERTYVVGQYRVLVWPGFSVSPGP